MTGQGDDSNRTSREGSGHQLEEAVRERGERVTPEVAERLAQMRRAAVEELGHRPDTGAGWRISPVRAGGLAGVTAAVALTLAMVLPRGPEPDVGQLLLADADELAVMSEMEVLEDLEFLAWLEQEGLDDGQG